VVASLLLAGESSVPENQNTWIPLIGCLYQRQEPLRAEPTKEEIRSKGYAILVEGYFDLILLWNAGITPVVATLEQLWQENRLIWLAGIRHMLPSCLILMKRGRKPWKEAWSFSLQEICMSGQWSFPVVNDPDDYVRTFGKDRLLELIARAPSMVDYYIENVMGDRALLRRIGDVLRKSLSFIRHIDNAVERNLLLKEYRKTWHWPGYFKNRDFPIPWPLPQTRQQSKKASGNSWFVGDESDPYSHDASGKIDSDGGNKYFELLYKSGSEVFGGRVERCSLPDRGTSMPLSSSAVSIPEFSGKDCWEGIDESSYDEKVLDRLLADTVKQLKRRWYREIKKILMIKWIRLRKQEIWISATNF